MIHPASDSRLWWLSAAGPSDCDCPEQSHTITRDGRQIIMRCSACGRVVEIITPMDDQARSILLMGSVCLSLLGVLCAAFGALGWGAFLAGCGACIAIAAVAVLRRS